MARTGAVARPGGYGLTFAGGAATDNINVLRSSTLGDLTQKSFACWCNFTSTGGGSAARILRRVPFLIQFLSFNSLGVLQTATGNGTWSIDPTTTPGFGVWFHLAVTYDRSGGSPLAAVPILYINGVVRAWASSTQPTGTITADGANNFIIGNTAAAAGNRAVDGTLANAYCYSRILTPSEVLSLYQGIDPDPTGLVFRYLMDEGAGSFVRDSSVNNFQGTILGATWAATPTIPAHRATASARTVAASRGAA